MLYYRFRPMSTLSVKELLYDELYFSYPHELNDPLDGMITFEFGEDYPKWKRLLDLAWERMEIDTTKIAEGFARNSPTSLIRLISSHDLLQKIIYSSIEKENIDLAPLLIATLKMYLTRFVPTEGCSVSLSRSYDNTLMWSHYTGKHEGYCLIFRSINDGIRQCPTRKKTTINVSEHTSIGVAESFKIHDVIYNSVRDRIDAFTLYPWGVYGRDLSDDERIRYHEKRNNAYLTKSTCWEYENESRLYIPPVSVLINRSHLPSIDRIFHYDNNQIAGVIYGMRMSEENKKIIREILLRKSAERYTKDCDDKYLFDIASFEAKFDDNQHNITITPSEIFNDGRAVHNLDEDFQEKLALWTSGEALHLQRTESGTSCKKITLD